MDHLSKRYGANDFCKSMKQSWVSYNVLKMEKAVQKISKCANEGVFVPHDVDVVKTKNARAILNSHTTSL